MTRRGKGEGSIFQKDDGRWAGQIDLGRDDTGKRRRKVIHGATKAAVIEEMQRLNGRAVNGESLPSRTPTIATFLNDWYDIKSIKKKWAHKTKASYRTAIDLHLIPAFGTTRVEHLTPMMIEKWILRQTTQHGARRRVELARDILRSALTYAKQQHLVGINNAAEIEMPERENDKAMVILDAKQRDRFVTAVKDHRLGAMFVLDLCLGLRVGELTGLPWGDRGIDLETGVVTIQQQLQWVESDESRREKKGTRKNRSRPLLVPVKSKSGNRVLQIPDFCLTLLREHRRQQLAERLKAGAQWNDQWGLAFTTYRTSKHGNGRTRAGTEAKHKIGTPLHPRNVHRVLADILKTANLPAFGMHTLRHNAASLLIALGVRSEELAKLLGHSETRLSTDTYGHLVKETAIKAARLMDAALGGK